MTSRVPTLDYHSSREVTETIDLSRAGVHLKTPSWRREATVMTTFTRRGTSDISRATPGMTCSALRAVAFRLMGETAPTRPAAAYRKRFLSSASTSGTTPVRGLALGN